MCCGTPRPGVRRRDRHHRCPRCRERAADGRLGVSQYLVKPFTFGVFRDRLEQYARVPRRRPRDSEGKQPSPRSTLSSAPFHPNVPPWSCRRDSTSADTGARHGRRPHGTARCPPSRPRNKLGMSRVVARRYLEHLVADGRVIRSPSPLRHARPAGVGVRLAALSHRASRPRSGGEPPNVRDRGPLLPREPAEQVAERAALAEVVRRVERVAAMPRARARAIAVGEFAGATLDPALRAVRPWSAEPPQSLDAAKTPVATGSACRYVNSGRIGVVDRERVARRCRRSRRSARACRSERRGRARR